MATSFKFVGVKDTYCRIAQVAVHVERAPGWAVGDGNIDPVLRREWGAALRAGVQRATEVASEKGCLPHRVEIVSVTEFPADSTEDAMACAAMGAVLTALLGPDIVLVRTYGDDRWTLSLGSP